MINIIDMAIIEKLQAEANHYQNFHELINEVPNDRPIDDESPYHVGITEVICYLLM